MLFFLKHTCKQTLNFWRLLRVTLFAGSCYPLISQVVCVFSHLGELRTGTVLFGCSGYIGVFCSEFFSAQGMRMGVILCISVGFNWVKVKLMHTLCLVVQGGVSSPISPYRAALQRNLKNAGMSWEWRHGQGRGEAEKWGVFVGFLYNKPLE